MPDGAAICLHENLILGENEIPAPSSVASTKPKIRSLSLSLSLLMENWFMMPSVLDKGIYGIVMAT